MTSVLDLLDSDCEDFTNETILEIQLAPVKKIKIEKYDKKDETSKKRYVFS